MNNVFICRADRQGLLFKYQRHIFSYSQQTNLLTVAYDKNFHNCTREIKLITPRIFPNDSTNPFQKSHEKKELETSIHLWE